MKLLKWQEIHWKYSLKVCIITAGNLGLRFSEDLNGLQKMTRSEYLCDKNREIMYTISVDINQKLNERLTDSGKF